MRARRVALLAGVGLSLGPLCPGAGAAVFFFSTGTPDGGMAMASRPSGSAFAVETADDFSLVDAQSIAGASFAGLIPPGAPLSSITQVGVEIYRVFPQDSNVGRTSGAPAFSTSLVPTRVNAPSDVAFAQRDSALAGLSFTPSIVSASFGALNSVQPGGIHPIPNFHTAGNGLVAGEEVSVNVTFSPTINLATGHYFFVPQVELSSGDFLWLSAPKPIVPPGTPFPVGSTDIQAWARDANLAPDWLRVGADIVGGGSPPQFNGAFSLSGASCTPISVSPASVAAATVGDRYAAMFGASGGIAPYTFSETGALPDGVALRPDGSLSGSPTQAGAFPIIVTATDADGCLATQNVTLTVAPAPATPGSTATPPGSPASPTAQPSLSAARLSPTTFRAAANGATLARKHRRPVGTMVSYRDSQAATTTFGVQRRTTGHRRGSKCVAGQPHRHQKRCTRNASVGSVTHRDAAGAVKVRFSARVRGRKLRPGSYRLTLTPTAGGRTGRTVTLAFRIVR